MSVSLERSSERVVVLLRPQEKKRLERLARKEHVSSAEILRRSLAKYEEPIQEVDSKVIAEMNATLDKVLANIRSTRQRVRENLGRMEEMRTKRE